MNIKHISISYSDHLSKEREADAFRSSSGILVHRDRPVQPYRTESPENGWGNREKISGEGNKSLSDCPSTNLKSLYLKP